ncbi:MAG: hypothetical protein HFE84_06125 [Lachnospiraceae bacterium]|nr:hypothetical protein [Lachnospiraceae bacterium]
MRRVIWWFLLSVKRYCRRPAFLAVLLILPALAYWTAGAEKKGDEGIRIAVCVEGEENELGRRLAESLTDGERAGMFAFYMCENEERLKDDVAARRAECGYVIEEGLEDRLDAGDIKRVIHVYSAPSTVTAELSTETVFAKLVQLYDRKLLQAYVKDGKAFEGLSDAAEIDETVRRAGELYDRWLTKGGVFRFEYLYGLGAGESGGTAEENEEASGRIFPVRGLAAVLIFITGLYGTVTLCEDEKRGLFLRLEYALRLPCRLVSLAAPVALVGAASFLAFFLGGIFTGVFRETVLLFFYMVLVVGIASILKMLVKNSQVICCLLPFFLIGSLIFCPVFLDLPAFVPGVSFVGKLFLPYYYLRWF